MSKTSHPEMSMESLYHEGNGYVFVKFIKPVKLARERFYKKRSIAFKVPL